jgi:hypothetical protein
MAKDKVEMLAQAFESAVKATLETAGKVPAEKRYKQLQAGKAHPLWLLGHLAFSLDTIVNFMSLGGAPQLPPTYFQKFAPANAGGKPVSSEPGDYPDWDEVVANYEKVGKATAELVRKLDDADLPGGVKGNPPAAFAEFFKVLGNTLAGMAAHDSYHRGQIGLLAALD